MRLALVFDDWRDQYHRSIYCTEKGVALAMSDFHSGTMFEADIQLDEESAAALQSALSEGYIPVFYAAGDPPESNPPPRAIPCKAKGSDGA